MDLTFYRYESEKAGEQIKGSTISKINKTYSTIIHNGIERIQFNNYY